jgi:hypothetical protein
MAIIITYKLPSRNLTDFCLPQTLEWAEGDLPPSEQIRKNRAPIDNPEMIVSITAIGSDSLFYMNSYFTGIPFYTRYADSPVTWTGEWAKFIYEHLGT